MKYEHLVLKAKGGVAERDVVKAQGRGYKAVSAAWGRDSSGEPMIVGLLLAKEVADARGFSGNLVDDEDDVR
ncbi:MAG: hypothetical protein CMB99_01175 [Flavobacteriaceae bacterium]|nr:hypothetical protein [Flavobacteriaceae bacterium]|tara:strand:+ start:2262 stop:2477 length:216 start_codon:yes stop_codon:yes gene_type:complete